MTEGEFLSVHKEKLLIDYITQSRPLKEQKDYLFFVRERVPDLGDYTYSQDGMQGPLWG